jgi:DNA-binding CsgD family transcriptional regulator
MLPDRPRPAADDACASRCCRELICLLRLSEIALAGPETDAGLRAMVDELTRLSAVAQASVALPEAEGRRLRHVAHRGLPGRTAHRGFAGAMDEATRRALTGLVIVQEIEDGEGHGRALVPILGGERALGVLGLGLRGSLPLDAWAEHVLWAASDLMALLLLERRRQPDAGAGGELRLTGRQRDVLFALVERGASNEDIAAELGLSARTVKIHLQAAYRRLGVRSRGEAIRLVLTRHADWLARERERRQGRAEA